LALVLALGCASVFPSPPRSAPFARGAACAPAGLGAGAAAREASLGLAQGALAKAFVAISNEHPEEHRQQIQRQRVPVQRFPRLTFPAILDPEPAGAQGAESWFFPLILAEEEIGYLPDEELAAELRFWLGPHGRDAETGAWSDVTGCLVRSGDDGAIWAVSSKPGSRIDGPDELLKIALLDFPTLARGEELRGLVFELPTRLASGADVSPGFYDLRVLPRLGSLRGVALATPPLTRVAAGLRDGDWQAAIREAQALDAAVLATPEAVRDLQTLSEAISLGHPAPNFSAPLRALSLRFERLARALKAASAPRAFREETGRPELELARVERGMREILLAPLSLAPVALRDPAREPKRCGGEACVRFAVAGDLQYHGNITSLLRFLERFDPEVMQPGAELSSSSKPSSDIDFVLLAGDVADSAASTAVGELGLNFLGVLPPKSPYSEEGGGEMSQVRDVLARFRKPFFAVPGNHDGYAGYGGLLNLLIDEFGNLVGSGIRPLDRDRGDSVAAGIKSVNDYVPTLVAWRLLNRMPRYDGLNEFQHYLGSLNVAFEFRGHSFVGVNSYDLTAKERAAMGGVILNWGGGLQDESVEWVENVLNVFAPEPEGGQQFVFMHHDPRAAVPRHSSFREEWFGFYDPTDSFISRYTFGHFGIGNSPETGLYFPIVTPLLSYFFRAGEIGWGDDSGVWQQAWMRKVDMPSFFDQSVYNGRDLIDVINCNLAGRADGSAPPAPLDLERCRDPQGAVSHVAFAHDNVPLQELWADPAQRRALFREGSQPWGDWTFSLFSYVSQFMGAKLRNGAPPQWAKRMRLPDDTGNARVLRLDDVGQLGDAHGFHLVTLYGDGRQEIQWVDLGW
jgi:hypothetical protein